MRAKEFITETTSAGSVATVVGGIGNMLYRNPSIYDNVGSYEEPKKKKKKAKYKTTKDKD